MINKNKALFVVVVALLCVNLASATDLLIHVDNSGNALFLGSTQENISSSLPAGVSVINGQINGQTSSRTSKSGDVWTFSYFLQNSNIEVFLPKGARITNTNGEVYISNDQIVIYNENQISVSYIIDENISSGGSSKLALIALIILIVAGGVIYYYRKKIIKKIGKPEKINVIQSVLSERENKIVETLKEKGRIKSSYLRKLSGIPKASFFRHIQELEKKGIIERSGEGRNKFIELKS